jgi:type I protein arginine methyltransferase
VLDDSGRQLRYHADLLRDRTRVEAFRRAITQTVRPGDVVIDAGCGTGILAAFACQAGAAQVIAIDDGPVSGLASAILAASGYSERVQVIRSHTSRLTFDTRADVLVSETLWNFGIGEGLVPMIRDLRVRALKPESRYIPERFRMLVAPVASPRAWASVSDWEIEIEGLDLRPARELAPHNPYLSSIDPTELLGAGQIVGSVDLRADPLATATSGTVRWEFPASATVHGLAGWFEADLAPGVSIDTRPGSGSHWKPVFLPASRPVFVPAGNELQAKVMTDEEAGELRWQLASNGDCVRQATFHGKMLDAAYFHRLSAGYRPMVDPRGAAATALLALFDSGGSVGEGRALLARDFAEAFPSERDAQDFLQGVISSFCSGRSVDGQAHA